jgi:hypothetical protein
MLSHFYKKSQSLNLSMSAFKGKKFFFKIVKFKKKKKIRNYYKKIYLI